MIIIQVSNRCPAKKGNPEEPERTFRCRCLDARAGADCRCAQNSQKVRWIFKCHRCLCVPTPETCRR